MENPICVIDANTFVDHVQDIKKWIYRGQLRLVVPLCTIEQVEQLYLKSVEPKPTVQEAPRTRSSGKPPKKEYPAFDINPRVAREYIGRLKNRKEQDAESEQRVFFQEKENHDAVRFQGPNDDYTPWKDLDLEEEKPESIEGPPTSWAEALRRKQNLANGISDKSASKAPTKPKLVARAAGSETSPWKIKKDAPKLSVKDVPKALRKLMSCALWYLHESIERNDASQLFLLSDQTETRFVAQKLNILARAPKEVAAAIASLTTRTDLDTFGELEQEFGVQQKSATRATKEAEEIVGEIGVSECANEDLSKDEDAMNNSLSSEGTANTDASSIVHEQDLEKQSFEPSGEEIPINSDGGENKVQEPELIAKSATLAAVDISKESAESVEATKGLADSIIRQDSEKRLSESINGLNLDSIESQSSLADPAAFKDPALCSLPESPLPPLQNVESGQPVPEAQTLNDTSQSEHTITTSASNLKATQEPEDSDEEVVVFIPQPKRLSAQQKLTQQSSRPSTPKEQSQQKPAGQSPQVSLIKAQPKGKAPSHSPTPSVVVQGSSLPINSPTVIDPDAFGRDSRVNLNASPRPPHNPNGPPHHRFRGNTQNAQLGQVARDSSRQLPRTSPPRSTQEHPRRLTPNPGLGPKNASNHRRQISGARSGRVQAPQAEQVMSQDVGSKAPAAAVLSNSEIHESRMVAPTNFVPQNTPPTSQLESDGYQPGDFGATEFLPRSAMPSAQLTPSSSQPRVYEAGEFVPRPPRPVRESKPRAPKPKVFEAAEFVPRDFVPRTAVPRLESKQYLPEPDSIEPRPSINDVDYVLKSGSTRASARGRGRLWTPT